MSRLLEIEHDIRPYLASLIVRALHNAKDTLVIPRSLKVKEVSEEDFDKHQLQLAAKQYNMYGTLNQME